MFWKRKSCYNADSLLINQLRMRVFFANTEQKLLCESDYLLKDVSEKKADGMGKGRCR